MRITIPPYVPTSPSNPWAVTLTDGTGTFSAFLTTAGVQSITATDSNNPLMTGTETGILVDPSTSVQLGFIQEPANDNLGSVITPGVSVAEEDQYGNIVTSDSTAQVALTLNSSTPGALLTGGGAMTFVNGLATFNNLEVNDLGTGYSLVASSTNLGGSTSASATSNSFSVVYNPILENFNNGLGAYKEVGLAKHTVTITAAAAHPGTSSTPPLGLSDAGDGNWYYRTDAPGMIYPGDTVSVYTEFVGAANGRSYFGFASTSKGTYSVVLAPNTNQLLIQNDVGYDTYTTLASMPLTFSYNNWYQVNVTWVGNNTGTFIVNLYSNNGTKLVGSLKAVTGDNTPGDFAFRAIGSTKYFDTVFVDRDGNNGQVQIQSLVATPTTKGSSLTSLATSGAIVYLEPVNSSSNHSTSTGTTSGTPTVLYTVTTTELALLMSKKTVAGAISELTSDQ